MLHKLTKAQFYRVGVALAVLKVLGSVLSFFLILKSTRYGFRKGLISDRSILANLVIVILTVFLFWPSNSQFKILQQNDHLIYRFPTRNKGGPRTIVIGHRGGVFGPENTMKNVKGSIKNGLEGIEFDVSCSL